MTFVLRLQPVSRASLDAVEAFTRDERIAYFSMEIALSVEIPTYSGGLGGVLLR
jgi:glucan phosphorylase